MEGGDLMRVEGRGGLVGVEGGEFSGSGGGGGV